MKNIEFKKKAVKYIESLDSQTKNKIKAGIEGLLATPPKGDIKKMQGIDNCSFRLRIGGYRIIYRETENSLIIDKVDSRGGIYK